MRRRSDGRTCVGSNGSGGLAVLLLLLLCGCGAEPQDALRIELRGALHLRAAQWTPVRLQFELPGAEGNPFDPADCDVLCVIEGPGGALSQPAFFTRKTEILLDHGREVARDTGDEHWEVRWTPREAGEYRWRITAKSGGQRAEASGTLECHPAEATGFVEVSDSDPRYFELSDGSFFYPLGPGMRSPLDNRWIAMDPAHEEIAADYEKKKTFVYDHWFERLSANGGNYCTVWMTPWWLGLEWGPDRPGYGGLGHYNQIHAAQLDRILELAEHHDIRVFLYVMNHGQLSSVVDAEWDRNPYNSALEGGLARTPADFFADPRCRQLHKNKLRYILARWGYSPALMGIGLCTETNWVEPYDGRRCADEQVVDQGISKPNFRVETQRELVGDWLREMAQYVKDTDIHGHIVSTQFAELEAGNELWGHREMDVILNNCYDSFINKSAVQEQLARPSTGVAEGLFGWSRYFERSARKPHLVAEWGGEFRENSKTRLASDLHVGTWAMAMTNCAGATGFWWVNEVDGENLWHKYKAVAQFTAGLDRRGRNLVSEQSRVVVTTVIPDAAGGSKITVLPHPFLSAITLSDASSCYAYIYHSLMSSGYQAVEGDHDVRFVQSTDAWLEIPDSLKAGEYRMEYWDTQTGEMRESQGIRLEKPNDESRRIRLAPIRTDVAIKLLFQKI